MLNVVLSPEVPDPSEFDPESFKEVCRGAGQFVRFVMKRDTRSQTRDNWSGFLDEREQSLGINLSDLWARGPERATPIGEIPKNSLDFNDLTSKSPKHMYRKVVEKLGRFESVSTIEGLFEELSAYSVNAPNITIYDKYLFRIDEDIIKSRKDLKNKNPKVHDKSLRILALICKAISSAGPPHRVTIVTEFMNTFAYARKQKKSPSDPEIAEYFSSEHYLARTENIARSTVKRLRQLFPALEDTEFKIFDCSNPSLGMSSDGMLHDRFILFGPDSLISSAGFAFRIVDKSGRWDDVSKLPENLSEPNVLSSTALPNSTYIVPVATQAIGPPRRAREISIDAA